MPRDPTGRVTRSRAGSTRDRSRERRRAPAEAPPLPAPPTPRLRRRKEPERRGRGLTGPGAEPPERSPRPGHGPHRRGETARWALSVPRAEPLPALSGPGPGLGPAWTWACPPARALPRPRPFPGPSLLPRCCARPGPTGSPGRGRLPGAAGDFGAEARGVRQPEGTHRDSLGTCIHFLKSRGVAKVAQGPTARTL